MTRMPMIVVYSHNELPHSKRNEQAIATHKNMAAPHIHTAEWKKPETKECTQYGSIYIPQKQTKLHHILREVFISGIIMKKSKDIIIINTKMGVTFVVIQ